MCPAAGSRSPVRTKSGSRPSVPSHLLDAAENVVLREGIGRLTLDAVAREARISKGGLIHHFPSKDALINALVHRCIDEWRTECNAAIDAQALGPGRVPRAILNHCLASAEAWTESLRRRGMVLVAALVHDSRHVEPLREVHRDLASRIAADGLTPGAGEAVQLAVDGLWFDWIFGLTELTPHRLASVRTALRKVVEDATPAAGRSTAQRKNQAGDSKGKIRKPASRRGTQRKGVVRA